MFHRWPPEEDIQRKRDQWRDDWAVADLDVALLSDAPDFTFQDVTRVGEDLRIIATRAGI